MCDSASPSTLSSTASSPALLEPETCPAPRARLRAVSQTRRGHAHFYDGVVRIGILHPGEMGAAIGRLLVGQGHDVLWLASGRSEATARRAEAAAMRPAGQEQMMEADVI